MTRVLPALLLILLACENPPEQRAAEEPPAPVQEQETTLPAVDSGAPKLLPADQADESFRDFRGGLLETLARKDTTALYAAVAQDIRTSFGPVGGIEDFRRMWVMDDPATRLWDDLARVLNMGGAFLSDSLFAAPYVYAVWPDTIDAFEFVAVTSPRAAVFRAPQAGASKLGTAAYSILRLEEWRGLAEAATQADTSWAGVVLPDGRIGWLRAEDVHSPVGWRAVFERRDGRWLMVAFVAGD
ncbi:hypothetical protein BH20GEM1_BH20GEM1_13090 [soil metagenome]